MARRPARGAAILKATVRTAAFFKDVAELTAYRTEGALRDWASYVRRKAKDLTGRRRVKSARPGKPPSKWRGGLSSGMAFNPVSRTKYVVGPLRRSSSNVARVLEHGGVATITSRTRSKNGQAAAPVRTQVTIAPRPYMTPAMQKTNAKVPKLLQKWSKRGRRIRRS